MWMRADGGAGDEHRVAIIGVINLRERASSACVFGHALNDMHTEHV